MSLSTEGVADFHAWTPWSMDRGGRPDCAKPIETDGGRDALDAAVIRLSATVVNDHLRMHALTILDDLDLPVPKCSRRPPVAS